MIKFKRKFKDKPIEVFFDTEDLYNPVFLIQRDKEGNIYVFDNCTLPLSWPKGCTSFAFCQKLGEF